MSVTLKTQKQNEINGLNNGKKSMIKVCTRKSIGKYMSGQEKSNKKMKKFVRLVINGVCEAEKSTIQDLTGYSCEQLPKPKLNNLLENICPGLCLENENWRDIKRDGYIECVNAYSKFSDYASISLEDAKQLVTDAGRYRLEKSKLRDLLCNNEQFRKTYNSIITRYRIALNEQLDKKQMCKTSSSHRPKRLHGHFARNTAEESFVTSNDTHIPLKLTLNLLPKEHLPVKMTNDWPSQPIEPSRAISFTLFLEKNAGQY